jgi:hypothetical protein
MQGFLVENAKLINALKPKDITGAAQNSGYINMGRGKRCCFVIQGGTWAGGTPAVTITQATDSSGTGAKALSFSRCFTQNDTTYTDKPTEVTGLSGSQALIAQASQMLIIEVHAQDLDLANAFNWIRINVASPGANADLLSCLAIVYDLPFAGKPATLPTAL